MHGLRLAGLATLAVLLVGPLALPRVAHAELTGPCEARANISGTEGGSYDPVDPKARTGVYVVPISGSADYTGNIAVDPPSGGRAISGSVQVALPLGAAITIKSWSDDDATRTEDAGTVTWDLPAVTPRGIEMAVSGSHSDLQSCSGAITVKLDGGITDSLTGIASIVLTGLAAVGMLFTGIPKRPL